MVVGPEIDVHILLTLITNQNIQISQSDINATQEAHFSTTQCLSIPLQNLSDDNLGNVRIDSYLPFFFH